MINKFKELFHDKFFIRALIFGLIINVFCISLFMCSPQVVHAASDVQVNYPFIIDEERNPTELSLDDIRDGFSEYFGNLPDHYIIYCHVIGDAYANGPHGWDYYPYYNFIISVNPVFDYPTTSNENSSFSIVNSTEYSFDYNTWYGGWASWQVNPNVRHTYTYSQLFNYGFGYILYGTEDYYQNYNDVVVWSYPPSDVIDPTAPDLSGLDLDSSLNTTTPPSSPTYSNNFNDPIPTWDTTAPFQSLFDIILWCFDRAYSMFESFREYLFSWFGYFIQMLTYLIQKIIDSIKFIVQWLYNQFLYWLNPYLQIWLFIKGLLFDEDNQKSVFDLIFEFFGAVAQWLAQFWQNSFIVNFWNNYVSNLEDIIEDVLDKIDDVVTAVDNVRLLFTRDPDYSLIVTSFYTTYFGQVYQAVMRLLGAIVDGFTSIQAPGTLSFTVNFSSAPAPFDSVGYLTFNFNWYENIRNVVVPIITTCVYFGFALHIVWSWRCMLMDTASLKPDVTIQPYSPTPGKAKVNYTSSGAAGGGLVPTWRTYPGQKRIRG